MAECVHAHGASSLSSSRRSRTSRLPECVLKRHRLPVSASWNPNFYLQASRAALDRRELRKTIRAAGQAAADAQACLADGVYLHGHEGYLLEQMTNPAYNRRKLGAYTGWQAFGIELVREVRKRCGAGIRSCTGSTSLWR